MYNKEGRMKKTFFKKNQGFTIIELSLIVLIIAILIVALTFTFTTARKRSRDEKRKTDLRAIIHALEMKYNDELRYPEIGTTETSIPPGSDKLKPYLYPIPNEFGGVSYYWYTDNDRQKFCVYFQLETNNKYFSCTTSGCRVTDVKCPDF